MSDDDRSAIAELVAIMFGTSDPIPLPQGPQGGLGTQPCCWTVNEKGEVVPM